MSIDNTQFDTALQSFKKARLSTSEKEQMKQVIMEREKVSAVYTSSPYQSLLRKSKRAVAGVCMVCISFGGVAYGATNSLPNDVLYPVKTEVIEPLIGLTKVSVKSKQEYQINLALERIDEWAELDSSGELDIQAQEDIAQGFQEHIQEAKSYELESELNLEIEQAIELFVDTTVSGLDIPEAQPAEKETIDSNQAVAEGEINTQQQVQTGSAIKPTAELIQEPTPHTKRDSEIDDAVNNEEDTSETENEIPTASKTPHVSVEVHNEVEAEINAGLGL